MRTNLIPFAAACWLGSLITLFCSELSFSYENPAGSAGDSQIIEDFSDNVVGQFPHDWGWLDGTKVRKINEAAKGGVPYVIREENGNKFLHADDTGQAVTIVSNKKWNVKKYPCIRWRWRVHQFPTGANERVAGKHDSAASLYITFYVNFFGIPRSIKYIWSNTLPLCDTFGKELGRATNTVVESGTDQKDVWITETINIYEHYKKVYGRYPPDETVGIAIRTDADGTHSRATADYDDFEVLADGTGKCE
jgi:hypothetical protein